ncbi:MAG: adenosylmethionine--8-amino-7-oxononanoate transaminase [Leptospiraceae bacterium]|nr:adenosylmethionine--8-amino-7-oxononanoate transaminase [Leptospiraceae bacterium]
MAVNPLWHPFTRYEADKNFPMVKKARGSLLYLADGRVLIDFVSSWWTILHGHGQRRLIRAVENQLRKIDHVLFAGFVHEKALLLAQELCQRTHFDKVFYSDNGSTAVEVGLKMAIHFEQNKGGKRKTIYTLEKAYHGDTFGAMSLAGKNLFTLPFKDYLFPVKKIPVPRSENYKAIKQILKNLGKEKPLLFVYEPLIQAAGGMVFHNRELLDEILYAMKRAGALLLADEVFTGFYRTGSFLASDALSTKPDIIALAKALSGGFLPLGATLVGREIFDAFLDKSGQKTFYHGHSYTAYPAACAAGYESLKILDRQKTQSKIAQLISHLGELAEKLRELPHLHEVRHRGMVLAFEVGSAPAGYLHHLRDRLYDYFLSHGLLIRPLGNTVYLLPPLSTTKEQLEKVYFVMENLNQHL